MAPPAVRDDDASSTLSSPPADIPSLKADSSKASSSTPSSQSPATNTPDTSTTTAADPTEAVKNKMDKMKVKSGPPTFLNLPCATEEAEKKFTVIPISTYTPKSLGDAPGDEVMACDCRPEYEDGVNHACGDDSGCINRYTSMECSGSSCGCGKDCQNMRFQRKQYADVSVIKTEFKGYGLRANVDLSPGQFIYEYVGEVIDEARFRRRRLEYDKEGIKHFYFMSLGKNEFVDATKKGNLARFCNHSCNPNCYVDKWIVGTKFRMGIFAKRAVIAGEELTFDYNVDRYGADAQKCYCGEPNCMGYIGGKTQTDGKSTAKVSDQIADALGIHKDGRRGRKTVGIDEEFVKVLVPRPLELPGVQSVAAVLLANSEVWIVEKILERVHSCEDMDVQSQLMRAHGYQIMNGLLKRFDKNTVFGYILDILMKWPRLTKNKITSSKIEDTIKSLVEKTEDEDIKSKAELLLKEWSKLDTAYRIPRRIITAEENSPSTPNSDITPSTPKANDISANFKQVNTSSTPGISTSSNSNSSSATPVPPFRPHIKKHIPGAPSGPKSDRQKQQQYEDLGPLPSGWSIDVRNGRRVYVSSDNLHFQEKFPTAPYICAITPRVTPIDRTKMLQSIMERAEAAVRLRREQEKAEAERKEREEEEKKKREEEERESYLRSLDELIRRDVEEERRAVREARRKERAERKRREKRDRVEKKLSEKEIEFALLKTHGPIVANIFSKKNPWTLHKSSSRSSTSSSSTPPPQKEDIKLLLSYLTKKIVASEIKRKGEFYCNLKKVPEKGTGYYVKMEGFVGEYTKKGRTWLGEKIKELRREKEREREREEAAGTVKRKTEEGVEEEGGTSQLEAASSNSIPPSSSTSPTPSSLQPPALSTLSTTSIVPTTTTTTTATANSIDSEDSDSEAETSTTPIKRAREEDEDEQREVELAVEARRREIERLGVWKGRDLKEVLGVKAVGAEGGGGEREGEGERMDVDDVVGTDGNGGMEGSGGARVGFGVDVDVEVEVGEKSS